MKRLLFSFVALLTLVTQVATAQSTDAALYETLSNKAPLLEGEANKVEVVLVFSYTCGTCYRLDPYIEKWAKVNEEKVNYVRLPYPGPRTSELYAKTYYAFEAMDKVEPYHSAFFDAIFNDNQRFIKKEAIADYFAKKYDMDKKAFLAGYDSFATNLKFKRSAEYMSKYYRVNYTPAVIVNGEYVLDIEKANRLNNANVSPFDQFIMVLDGLVKQLSEKDTSANSDANADEK